MFEKLEILRTAQAMAAHAGARQALIAENVANADTPGYRARDLPDFATAFRRSGEGMDLRATRPAHLGATFTSSASQSAAAATLHPDASAAQPNGNAVSLEGEMVKAAEVRQQHDTALSIYRAASDILRASLGRIR